MSMKRGNQLWKVRSAFGADTVYAVFPDARNWERELTDDEVQQIAVKSTVPYYTNDKNLWSDPYGRGERPISAADALKAFGLDVLADAQEYGSASSATIDYF
jgi:hypothetical protein